MGMVRLTTAQALVRFLANQYVERDGVEHRFFAGCFGIFGHGNVAGLGQALQQYGDELTYYQARNEQGMVHTAAGFAKMKNRLATFACTSSIGPGATNMVTGAALATINRLPVLLLPGDIFASRGPDPVLQQLETPHDGDLSVNDCFRPVSRYWDRINRPEQLMPASLAAMRVLTNQAETGAVTLALPQDVQAEAYDFPEEFLRRRVWRVRRPLPDPESLDEAAALIREARHPLIVAGGGVIYSEATEALRNFVEATGIPVAETQAGKGSLPYDHPSALGAVGVTGTRGANRVARDADVVIGIGTRWTDFTTASKTAFQNPEVRFVNINVADFDAAKHAGLSLVGDAGATIEALSRELTDYQVEADYRKRVAQEVQEWDREVERFYTSEDDEPRPAQSAVIGAVNTFSDPSDVVVCASGSMPGDLHKLWRTRDPQGYQVEYGYSCMGYEIAGGLGAKMAAPEREVYVMVGDGSYLMLNGEIVTSTQERQKLTIVLVDNHGFASIGELSGMVGSGGFGTHYRYRENGSLGTNTEAPGELLPVDLATNAESLGAHVIRTSTIPELKDALAEAKSVDKTVVIYIETNRETVPDYESQWDVPIAEVSGMDTVRAAREGYEAEKQAERRYL
jgi:3D-(3,5/4)-trihydroxycyclohexane-1,2-dione acylhydrolase (decyclizing)